LGVNHESDNLLAFIIITNAKINLNTQLYLSRLKYTAPKKTDDEELFRNLLPDLK
jgi:hypothetical protein